MAVNALCGILLMLDDNESSDSESDDELLLRKIKRTKNRPLEIDNHSSFYQTILKFSDDDFETHFHMKRSTVDYIENKIGAFVLEQIETERVTVRKQVLIVLWILTSLESMRSISERFNIRESVIWEASHNICNVLSRLSAEEVRWPSEKEMQKIAEEFYEMVSFPGVVGCINTTHIPIKAPEIIPESYINRKGYHSVILQAVVDSRACFTDCYIGEAGSTLDISVFQKSRLGRELQNMLPPNFHLVGDTRYPMLQSLLIPFHDNGLLTQPLKRYNQKLTKARFVLKRAFAILKGRFKRLKHVDLWNTVQIPAIIMTCCVLHNICQNKNDILDKDSENYIDLNLYDSYDAPCAPVDNISAANKGKEIVFCY